MKPNNMQQIWRIIGTPRFLFFFIAVWAAVVMFSGIPFGDLSGYDDAAYAHEARNILQSGDWWTLNLNGSPDFDKPPLFIWLLALSFKIFGITDVAAKVPGVIFGWATIVLVYFLAREIFLDDEDNKWLAAFSMLCLATTQYFLKYSSHAMTDVPFTFFFTLAVYFYLRGLKNGIFLLASGAAVGLAMLTRSPMGFFPLAIIVFHLVFRRQFKTLFSFYFAGSLVLAIAIPSTWYWTEYAAFGQAFIGRHFANFMAHSEAAVARTPWQQFLWYFEYLFLVIKLYFPWFPLMFYGMFLLKKKNGTRPAAMGSLLVIWLLVVIIPFSLADSKVLRYILPAFPVFSILAASALKKLLYPKYLVRFSRAAAALLSLAAVGMVMLPNYRTRAEDMRTIAPISDAAAKPDENILLYTSGEYQWNFQNQLLWYGNRNCTFIRDKNEIEKLLPEKQHLIVIMDKTSFYDLAAQGTVKPTILGESENFVCFRVASS
jgi:4-amino-4-deoxy-L-arabinose transferase-like glycosyltransferase